MQKFVWIVDDKCDRCGRCVPVCLKHILEFHPSGHIHCMRWHLCDGCGECVRTCDKGGIEVGELTPSFEEKSISYFDRAGPVNTRKLCELVASRVREGVKYVVVTSTSGTTALMMADEFRDLDAKLIVFTIPPVWKDIFPFVPTIREDVKKRLEAKGIRIMEGVLPAIECGPNTIECSCSQKERRQIDTVAIWEILHGVGGQGLPTAVEAIFTAVKEGEVPIGAEVIGVGGTGNGADTAIVMKATPYEQMLSGPKENRFDILEIIALPRSKIRYW